MEAKITVGWSPGMRRLNLIRLLHEKIGYSVAKSEYLVGRLYESRSCFLALVQEDEEAATELAEQIRAAGAVCEVTVRDEARREGSLEL